VIVLAEHEISPGRTNSLRLRDRILRVFRAKRDEDRNEYELLHPSPGGVD